ncbi:MAG: hypothetical protein ACYSTN_03875, partial [Planctomycetota bacterium]
MRNKCVFLFLFLLAVSVQTNALLSTGIISNLPHHDADPDGVDSFIIQRNIFTARYGFLGIDDIHIPAGGGWSDAKLDGTWWFQGDGTGNFISAPGAVILA